MSHAKLVHSTWISSVSMILLGQALKEQYHAGLAMLVQCVERCPDNVWTAGEHPRTFWRIPYHAAYYTHLYLGQDEAAFRPWERHRESAAYLWGAGDELPEVIPPYSREELLRYVAQVDALVDPTIETLDLERADTGFPWYREMSKLSHS